MKMIALILSLTALFLGSAAWADFNTDSFQGTIGCSASNGKMVSLNADRTAITVTSGTTPKVYNVTARNSDGDTFVNYTAKNGEATIALTLGDQEGDYYQEGTFIYPLSCPQ